MITEYNTSEKSAMSLNLRLIPWLLVLLMTACSASTESKSENTSLEGNSSVGQETPNSNQESGKENSSLIPLNSPAGEQLLISSNARQDYLPLSIHFVTQDNLAYCGVASMVMVLNSLEIPAPVATEYRQAEFFTQNNLFNEKTEKIIPAQKISRQGMTLAELGQLLATYPIKVEVYHSSDSSLPEFRQKVVENLQQPDNFVLVNYLRSAIGQKTGGHISPLAAYNQETDSFLILDVSRYKYPPIWVKAEELWQAMNTEDKTSGKTRGFVLVSKN